jgi:hypothetical protein
MMDICRAKMLFTFIVCIVATSASTLAVAVQTPDTTALIQLRAYDGVNCIQIPNSSGADMTAPKLATCTLNANYLWYSKYYNATSRRMFQNVATGLCLDLVANSDIVYQRPCTGATSQLCTISLAYPQGNVYNYQKLVNVYSGKCLAVDNYTDIVQRACGSSQNSGPAWRSLGFSPTATGDGF